MRCASQTGHCPCQRTSNLAGIDLEGGASLSWRQLSAARSDLVQTLDVVAPRETDARLAEKRLALQTLQDVRLSAQRSFRIVSLVCYVE